MRWEADAQKVSRAFVGWLTYGGVSLGQMAKVEVERLSEKGFEQRSEGEWGRYTEGGMYRKESSK